MKYEVYCELNLSEYITVEAESEEDACFYASEIFYDGVKNSSWWKDIECSVVDSEDYQ